MSGRTGGCQLWAGKVVWVHQLRVRPPPRGFWAVRRWATGLTIGCMLVPCKRMRQPAHGVCLQDHGYLTNMAVAPSCRRQGVGGIMLQVRHPCWHCTRAIIGQHSLLCMSVGGAPALPPCGCAQQNYTVVAAPVAFLPAHGSRCTPLPELLTEPCGRVIWGPRITADHVWVTQAAEALCRAAEQSTLTLHLRCASSASLASIPPAVLCLVCCHCGVLDTIP